MTFRGVTVAMDGGGGAENSGKAMVRSENKDEGDTGVLPSSLSLISSFRFDDDDNDDEDDENDNDQS